MSIKTINVIRWKNYNKSEKYTIDLFEDDSIEDGISKIALTINNKSRFYVWNDKFPQLLFSIEDIKWKGFNNNPLNSTDRSNDIIKQPIIYKYNYGLCYFNNINIIFEDDFSDLKNNPYYFTEKKYKPLSELKKRETKLLELQQQENKITENRVNIHRFQLTGKLTSYQYLADVYDKLNTNEFIQYIQWVNDSYTLVHKLYMYHSISNNTLKNWTNIDKITDTRCINCYCPIGTSSNSYAKITINNDMTVTINFILDLRKNMTLEMLEHIVFLNYEIGKKQQLTIEEYLQRSLNEKITFKPIAIKVYNYISVSNVGLDKLAKVISSQQDIFKLISYKKSINLIYKRSSNFTSESFDYNIYVRNRLILGVDKEEIIEELLTFNFTEDEANKMIEQELDFLTEMEQQKIKADVVEQKLHTIVIVKLSKTGFDIVIHNIPNKTELNYLTFWLSKIVSASQEKIKEVKKKTTAVVIKPKSISRSSSSSSKSDNDSVDLGKIRYSSSSSNGGALTAQEKENQRYKITLLQNTDKDLFGENYSRLKCQKKSQPLVISKQKRDELIKKNKYYVDNELYYGSKKDNMNYYICPRLWCKTSKVPANPETGECPIEDEDRIESFFDKPNEIGVKRYVHLIKPNGNDICAPCCFKKPPNDLNLSKCKNYETYDPKNALKTVMDEKDENYLVTANAPINSGRYGTVPKQLQDLFLENKEKVMLVRKGIIHKATTKEKIIHTDSLIYALIYLIDYPNKEKHLEKSTNIKFSFIQDIQNKLDLITYVSLENGNVCKAFMDRLPLVPSENESLIYELQEYLIKFPKINDLYKLDFTNINNYKLSRFLAIFKSYKKFLDYLNTNSYSISKSPFFLYALISILYNKLLVIFEKNNDNINVICPYYTSYDDLIAIMEINPEMIILLKDGKYYEPIELRHKNKTTSKIFKLNDYPKLQGIFDSCSINNTIYESNNKIYQELYTLNNWIKTKVVFKNYNKFIFDTILINNDLTIERFITKGGILITIGKIGISFLPRIITDLNIKTIAFYDDYVNKSFNINIYTKDLETFKSKIDTIGIKYDIGIIDESNEQIYSTLTIGSSELDKNDIIHSRIEDDLFVYDTLNEKENKKWFQLQIMVFNKLLEIIEENDSKLQELFKLKRIDYVNKILSSFKDIEKNPDREKIRIIIEEIPIYSVNHIKNYLNKMILYYKYNFLDSDIKTDSKRKQFLFSQVALKNGKIPTEILNYHKSAPLNNFTNVTFNEKTFDINTDIQIKNETLPSLMEGSFEPLNSKWTMHKKSLWYQMQYLKVTNYSQEKFIEFFEWFSQFINIKTTYQSLVDISIQKLKDFKNNEKIMKTLFRDKTIFNSFVSAGKKKISNVNNYWTQYYSQLSNSEKLEIIENIYSKGFYINDLIILTMTQILNVSVLLIHRAIYGTGKDEDIRGDLKDLVLSSTFMKAPNNYINRPLLIFYKTNDDLSKYYLVFNKNIIPITSKNIYLKLNDIPKEFKELVDEHIKLNI